MDIPSLHSEYDLIVTARGLGKSIAAISKPKSVKGVDLNLKKKYYKLCAMVKVFRTENPTKPTHEFFEDRQEWSNFKHATTRKYNLQVHRHIEDGGILPPQFRVGEDLLDRDQFLKYVKQWGFSEEIQDILEKNMFVGNNDAGGADDNEAKAEEDEEGGEI